MLSLDIWDILVAVQPSSEEWHIAIRSGSCPDVKGEDYDHDSVYRIVHMLKLDSFQGSV